MNVPLQSFIQAVDKNAGERRACEILQKMLLPRGPLWVLLFCQL